MYHIDHQKYGKFTHNLITPHKNGRFMRFSDLIVHTSSYMHFSILYRVYLRKRKEHVHAIAK